VTDVGAYTRIFRTATTIFPMLIRPASISIFPLFLFVLCLACCAQPAYAQKKPVLSDIPEENKNVTLAPGVVYTLQYHPKSRWSVHTVTVDLTRNDLDVHLGKGLENIAGLERVQSIMHRRDSLNLKSHSVAGINASYWEAGTHYPIGPTVIDGQILINEQHHRWSSLAMTKEGALFLDQFSMQTEVRTRYGILPITRFNHRHDSLSRVIYTPYFGNTVPFLDTAIIALASRDTITDDSEIETLTSMIDSMLQLSQESGTLKVQFEILKPMMANTIIPCRITSIDTGVVAIPQSGGVLSFGKGPFPLFFSLFVGDTFSLVSRLDPVVPAPVALMASGTPRLVRDGHISVEWQEEGLRKLRFVNGRFARSAVGISKDGKKLILMTVEASNRRGRRTGVSLPELARLMVDRGAYHAMNFDGGGSATMVIGDETVAPRSGSRYSRKISTSLFITRKTP
jgi:hypothetical protein